MASPSSPAQRWLCCLIAAMIVALVGSTGFTGSASATPSPDADGVSNLATCYSAKKKMAVEMVIDESMSLNDNDPLGARVDLARAVSEALTQIAAVPLGAEPGRIDLQVVGFGTEVEVVVPWTGIDRATADSIAPQLDSFRDRHQQKNTDYVDALTTARGHVLEHAASMGKGNADGVCRAVFWFTDGQFDFSRVDHLRPGWAPDLDVKTDEAAVIRRGEGLLCDPDGIADQYRSSETYLLTAALLSNGFKGGDDELLKRITEGDAHCGAIPGRATGTYFSSADVRRLVISFVPAVIGPPPPIEQRTNCRAGVVCVEKFHVTEATVAVNLFVDSQPGGRLALVSPDGGMLDLVPKASDRTLAGAKLASRAAGGTRLVTIDLDKATQAAIGEWQVQFKPDNDPAHLSIWVSARTGLSLLPIKAETWTRGQPGTVVFQVVDHLGRPLASSAVAKVNLVGRVTHGDDVSKPIPLSYDPSSARATLAYTPDLAEPASSATVGVIGTVATTAGEQSQLGASAKVSVKVANAPQGPDSLNIGVVTARRQKERDADRRQPVLPIELERTLSVLAGADGGGTFCITDGSSATVGSQAAVIRPIGGACRHIDAGARVSIPVRISIEEPGQGGTLTGYVAATTQSDLGIEKFAVSIPVRGDVVVPPGDPILDSPTFWKLVIISLFVPGVLWLALSYLTSMFNRPTTIKGFRVPATVRPANSEFETPSMSSDDFEFLTAPSPRTHTVRFEELTLTAPVRIFRSQDAIVERPGHVVHGSLGAGGHGKTAKGRIAHQIQGQWAFAVPEQTSVVDPAKPLTGDLYLFVRDDAFALESEAGGLLDRSKKELSARLPDIIKRLQRLGSARSSIPGKPSPPERPGTPEAPAAPTGQGGLM